MAKSDKYQRPTTDVERYIRDKLQYFVENTLTNVRHNPRAITYIGSKSRVLSYDEVHNTFWVTASDGRVYEVRVDEVVVRPTGPTFV